MRTPNPFPQLAVNRAVAALARVRALIWRDRERLEVLATPARAAHRSLEAARRERLRPAAPGSAWGRLYDQRWCRIRWPRLGRGPRYLEWRDQGEATLWVDGVPYYGFDVAHRQVVLPARVREVWVESICCQSAIWHPEATGLSSRGSVFDGASLVTRDDDAWQASHDFAALVDVMLHVRAQQSPPPPRELPRVGLQPTLAQATPLYRRILRLLDEAVDALDTAGVAAARRVLGRALAGLRDAKPLVRAVLTGHAHIDLVWLWPERVGEAKAVHTFATMNRLMELYPEFRFAYSQTASYDAVARRAPTLSRLVAGRISEGRWEATGALRVESDTMLPCGEALARSFLLGQEDFVALRGEPSRLLWLPDVFGYSACLPQLMRLSGVPWFFTTKLTWSAISRFPFSSFRWRGNDGSEVVAHVTQDSGYNNLVDLPRLHAAANGHVQSDVHPEFLHPTGYGDGGGGPTEAMCERARRLGGLGGTPALTWDQPEAFFARLEKRRAALPVWQGECYLEYHRGTFTTHGRLKSAFRALERALQVREAAGILAGRAPDLREPWRRLIFAQFHDYIPGSSVAEVYAEGVPELERLVQEQCAAAERELNVSRGMACVFNPLPQPWRGCIRHPETGRLVAMALPPLSTVPLAAAVEPGEVRAGPRWLESDRVRAELDGRGALRRLRVDGRDIALAGPAAQAVLYPDQPANFEAWDIDRHSLALGVVIDTPAAIEVEAKKPGRADVVVRRRVGRASTMILRYHLVAGEPVLRLEVELEWREPHALLQLHFPTAYRGTHARFGAPFGSVLRGQQPGAPQVEAQWEVPASRWAAVSHDGEREGFALITEAKYGFSARDGELTVSLVRSPRMTGHDDHRTAAPPVLSRLAVVSPFTDQGRHVIRLAVGAYVLDGAAESHPAALADTLFTLPHLVTGRATDAGLLGIDGAPTLVPAWARPLERGAWLLRLHEVGGQSGRADVCLAPGWSAWRCGLDGAAVSRPRRAGGPVIFRPYEIVSLRIERA